MQKYKVYCGGEFLESSLTRKVLDKYSGEEIAEVCFADEPMLERAIQKAQQVHAELSSLSSFERSGILREIGEKIQKEKERLSRILCQESAKPIFYARAEIDRAAQTFFVAAEECKRSSGEHVTLDWTAQGKGREGLVKYFPIGIVGGISPFNFPLNLAVHKIAPAIAAACPIVLKPSSLTPLSTLELAGFIDSTSLPKGSVSVLPMDRMTGNRLVTEERVKLLCFTGSPEIGWEMKKQSGKKKVVLELGGNAGVIISAGTNIRGIIDKCIVGAFSYSGQICNHAQRFIVHESLFEEFCTEMIQAAGQLKKGDPLQEDTRISSMIDEENAMRAEQWVSEAQKAGARILCGGKREGSYYEPTILTGTNRSMKVYAEEVFGPVICVEKYAGGINNAIEALNDTRFGLQCGVFTDSVKELDAVFRHAEVGGVIHNDVPTLRFDHMPYGGVKDSGLGREGVKYAIMDMLETKILVK